MRSVITSMLAVASTTLVAARATGTARRDEFFTTVFSNLTAATQSPSYMTFTLVDPANAELACKEFCLQICDCKSVNMYLDNFGKGITLPNGQAALYSCSAFNQVIDETMNTNLGGQDQHGDGHLNFITESYGFVVAF